jgi:hypothetical protein
MHPTEKKAPDGSQASAQVCVLAAGFGHRRAEFGEGQRAKKGKQSAGNPCGVDHADRAADGGHFARLQKYSRADHRADDDRCRSPGTQAAYQIEAFLRMDAGCDIFLPDNEIEIYNDCDA